MCFCEQCGPASLKECYQSAMAKIGNLLDLFSLLCSPGMVMGTDPGLQVNTISMEPDFPELSVDELLGGFGEEDDFPAASPDPDDVVGDDEEAWDDMFLEEDDAAAAETDDDWNLDDFGMLDHQAGQGSFEAAARPGSVQWWKENADRPVAQTGDWTSATVRQIAVSLTEAVLQHNVRDSAFDDIIKVIRHLCIQPGSLFPPSKYIMVRLMEASSLESSMYHLCIACGDHVWEPLSRSSWRDHFDDICPNENCQGRRFKETSEGCAEIEPTRVSPLKSPDGRKYE